MSQLKRNSSQFRGANAQQPAGAQHIDDQQPHPTLALQREPTPWAQGPERGGDPYNAAGPRLLRKKGS